MERRTGPKNLGHAIAAAPAVTHRSYVGRDTVRNAAVKRGLRVLQGGRGGNSIGHDTKRVA
jgi:predicted transcriptional regulator